MGKFTDLSGQRFGLLTVVKPTGEIRNSYIEYLCRCACGGQISTTSKRLRSGDTRSCGCLRVRTAQDNVGFCAAACFVNIKGERFGRWKVLEYAGKKGRKGHRQKYYWLCRCACGYEALIDGAELRGGGSKSCGCLKAELAAKRLKAKPIWPLSQQKRKVA